jgi:hypothetical protein
MVAEPIKVDVNKLTTAYNAKCDEVSRLEAELQALIKESLDNTAKARTKKTKPLTWRQLFTYEVAMALHLEEASVLLGVPIIKLARLKEKLMKENGTLPTYSRRTWKPDVVQFCKTHLLAESSAKYDVSEYNILCRLGHEAMDTIYTRDSYMNHSSTDPSYTYGYHLIKSGSHFADTLSQDVLDGVKKGLAINIDKIMSDTVVPAVKAKIPTNFHLDSDGTKRTHDGFEIVNELPSKYILATFSPRMDLELGRLMNDREFGERWHIPTHIASTRRTALDRLPFAKFSKTGETFEQYVEVFNAQKETFEVNGATFKLASASTSKDIAWNNDMVNTVLDDSMTMYQKIKTLTMYNTNIDADAITNKYNEITSLERDINSL